ncbi:MAG: TetR/AcrR family transcriptional regulator [Sandaracinaceae bacterium]|nr:TetR/AcrR family transcriptional regulator [Sandaracinaceae bacterium]
MPTANPTTDEGASKKERILDAALGLFAERGYHGTAVPLVAEAAGVGAGTIYRYFEGKQGLVNELFRREKRAVTNHVLGSFPFSEPPRSQFHYFFGRIVEWARTQPQSFQFLEHHHHGPYLDEDSLALEREVTEYALNYVRMLKTTGIARDADDHLFLVVVWGTIVRMMREAWNGSLELTDAFLAQAEEACWEAIKA